MKPQKYAVNEHVTVQGWGSSATGTVTAVEWVYHHRLGESTWGYHVAFDEGQQNPLTFVFIPEGYLRKDKKNDTVL